MRSRLKSSVVANRLAHATENQVNSQTTSILQGDVDRLHEELRVADQEITTLRSQLEQVKRGRSKAEKALAYASSVVKAKSGRVHELEARVRKLESSMSHVHKTTVDPVLGKYSSTAPPVFPSAEIAGEKITR